MNVEQDVVPPVGENCESQLSDFFNNSVLSDLTLKNPDTEGTKPVHKAILASGSQYFLSLFKKDRNSPELNFLDQLVKGLDVPRPVKTQMNPNGLCSDEIVNLILKFIYYN